jgi:succinate dehydrogenase / fumarate reductase, flavoprotein subunit
MTEKQPYTKLSSIDKAGSLKYDFIKTEVLIIGAGAAGLRAAIELHQKGVDCLVIGKRKHGDAHTIWAAGGINAALGNLDPEDRWQIHAADTLREGHFINNPEMVEVVCQYATQAIKELHQWGCPFNLTPEKKINQRFFGAQSFRRTCFVGDRTGEAILETLVLKAKTLQVPYRQNVYITQLIKHQEGVCGALGFDMETDRMLCFHAKCTILAAGGYSGIYKRHSSRPDENTGDGPALALMAGAKLQDMEMVQFHPTGMVKPLDWKGRLVTEATRGEGGRLYNAKGERFMERYSPEQMELDARDIVARAIYREIEAGNGTSDDAVFLDISHKEKSFIKKRLPKIYDQFLAHGVDITKTPMEVAPTCHYAMGGVQVDPNTGATNIKGLYCLGETTAGLHGANRLGGNSLIETVVLGKICGEHIASIVKSISYPVFEQKFIHAHFTLLLTLKDSSQGEDPLKLTHELKEVMWRYAGIIRNEKLLKEGLFQLAKIEVKAKKIQVNSHSKNFEAALNLHFMLPIAKAVVSCALMREESRGAHFRDDFPEKNEAEFKRNIICSLDPKGNLSWERKPVKLPSMEITNALKQEYTLDYHQLE